MKQLEMKDAKPYVCACVHSHVCMSVCIEDNPRWGSAGAEEQVKQEKTWKYIVKLLGSFLLNQSLLQVSMPHFKGTTLCQTQTGFVVPALDGVSSVESASLRDTAEGAAPNPS